MSELRLAFSAGGRRVGCRVRAPALADRIGGLYPDYRVPPGAEAPELTLTAVPGGGFRIEGPEGVRSLPDPGAALSLFEVALAELLLESQEGVVRLHGAGVAGRGGALLLSGPGGAGKSTLTAGLAARGFPVFGDDVVLLDPDTGSLRPFKRLLKVETPALDLLGLPRGAGPPGELWSGTSLFHPRALGSRWAEPGPVRTVVFPRRDLPAGARLEPVSGGETVRRLLRETLFVDAVGVTEFEAASRAVEGARFYDLRFGGLTPALDLLAGLLR